MTLLSILTLFSRVKLLFPYLWPAKSLVLQILALICFGYEALGGPEVREQEFDAAEEGQDREALGIGRAVRRQAGPAQCQCERRRRRRRH
jgi:hypothetical protein